MKINKFFKKIIRSAKMGKPWMLLMTVERNNAKFVEWERVGALTIG